MTFHTSAADKKNFFEELLIKSFLSEIHSPFEFQKDIFKVTNITCFTILCTQAIHKIYDMNSLGTEDVIKTDVCKMITSGTWLNNTAAVLLTCYLSAAQTRAPSRGSPFF